MLPGSRRLRIAVALLVAVAAVGVGAVQLLPFLDRKATLQSAETTEGTIVSAAYDRNQYDVTYRYTVDGETYETDRVFLGPYPPDGTAGQNAREALPVYESGETVAVYYDSTEPSTAWLVTRPGLVGRHVLYFLVTGFLALVCVTYVQVERTIAGLSSDPGALGADHAAGLQLMQEVAAEADQDPPETEAEAKRRIAERLPDEAVEQARGPDGELDLSRLEGEGGGRPTGLLGRAFALLRSVALVFGGGIVALVVTGVLLVSYLTP